MRLSRIIIGITILGVPTLIFFAVLTRISSADSTEEPYSIYIIAGQSQAEGSNAFRINLPDDTLGFYKQRHEADAQTKFWWAGADGVGPRGVVEQIQFLQGQTFSGWTFSGFQNTNDGDVRMTTLAPGSGQRRNAGNGLEIFGPEYGISRTLYGDGRRKVIILKVSYGFQSLAQSGSVTVPYDWNVTDFKQRNKSYNVLVNEFKRLTDHIRDRGEKYTVDGFFWHQGGTDVLDPNYAAAHPNNFDNLVNDARSRFELHPDAHFVAAKIGYQHCVNKSIPPNDTNPYYCGFPYLRSLEPLVPVELLTPTQLRAAHPNYVKRLNLVRKSLQDTADRYPWVDVVDNNDLQRSGDNVHLSEVAQLNMGKRFAEMYRMPYRVDGSPVTINGVVRTSGDYDGDGIPNSMEDTGNAPCHLVGTPQALTLEVGGPNAGNGNLADDDCDGDGYPNYLDRINGPGSGL